MYLLCSVDLAKNVWDKVLPKYPDKSQLVDMLCEATNINLVESHDRCPRYLELDHKVLLEWVDLVGMLTKRWSLPDEQADALNRMVHSAERELAERLCEERNLLLIGGDPDGARLIVRQYVSYLYSKD